VGAAIEGGRWNHEDVPAVYMGLSPAICCLETYVHASGQPAVPLKITCFELPATTSLFWEPKPEELPRGWALLPADRPSMDFGTDWLRGNQQLGMIVPSAVLPLERNVVINPRHQAVVRIKVIDVFDFAYDSRMLDRL
jgi:RES domain-containing protein